MSKRQRIGVLLGSLILAVIAVLFVPPVPQDLGYHRFADGHALLGVPNFWNVLSNLPFAVVGLIGLWFTERAQRRGAFAGVGGAWPYRVFFIGVALVSLGSAWYHFAPGNGTLVWDRLPMTLAFMALVAALVADRIDAAWGVRILLPVLLLAGIASVWYWAVTEAAGHGDLRFYALVQFFPMLAVPLICWLFPAARVLTWRDIAWLFGFYILAKLLEEFDTQVFEMLGGVISGHSLKHVAAAGAPAVVVYRIMRLQGHRQGSTR
ncbi:MAG: ceramidase domain-containing protein [Novosphingobium sp.]